MAETLLGGARLVTADGERPGWVRVRGSRVVAVGVGAAPAGAVTDLGGRRVVPGWVDIHNHGGAGVAFTDPDPEAIRAAAAAHHARGTTSVVASLVTADPATLLRQVRALAEVAEDGHVAGIHLEGPYLAAARCGAHDPALLRPPDRAELDRLVAAGRGYIRMVTVAPELPGALEVVRAAVAHGVTPAVGHTDADHDQARAAFDAGARVATHLFNAMRPLHHREPGPIAAALDDERVTVELINDGVHVHPTAARLALAAAGVGRVALVTDAMAAAGMADGDYQLGGLDVRVAGGRATLAGTDTIAGSTIHLYDAVRAAVHDLGLPLPRAVRAATETPARALGLAGVGTLTTGDHADLVVLDDALEVVGVMRRGAWLRRPR